MPERRQTPPETPRTRRSAQFTLTEAQALDGAAAIQGIHPGDLIREAVNNEIARLQNDRTTINRGRTKRNELRHEIADLSGQLEAVTVFLAGANPQPPTTEASQAMPETED